MKKLKKTLAEYDKKRSNHIWNQVSKPKEEDLFQLQLIEMIQKEQYLGVYILIGEKLRSKAKEDSLVEDKRNE